MVAPMAEEAVALLLVEPRRVERLRVEPRPGAPPERVEASGRAARPVPAGRAPEEAARRVELQGLAVTRMARAAATERRAAQAGRAEAVLVVQTDLAAEAPVTPRALAVASRAP